MKRRKQIGRMPGSDGDCLINGVGDIFLDCIGSVAVAGEITDFTQSDRIGIADQNYTVADMDAVVKKVCAAYAVMMCTVICCADNSAA